MVSNYPRELIGYGQNPPHPHWPNNAQLALQFVINYEEGSENCILHGDAASEAFLSEIIGASPLLGDRNMNMESMYEYGSRAGFWRLHRLFTQRDIPLTVYAVAMALERNPEAAAAMVEAKWEVASHGYRWIDYQYVGEDVERSHIQKAIEIHTKMTGDRPLGIYQGRNSPNTRRLIVEAGGFLYDADSYADDLPLLEPRLRQTPPRHPLHPRQQRHALRHRPGLQLRRSVLHLLKRRLRHSLYRRRNYPKNDERRPALPLSRTPRQNRRPSKISRLRTGA